MISKVLAAAMILALLLADISKAFEIETIVAYRGLDGTYSRTSNKNFKEMRRAARAYGQIEVWVTFDMEFQGDPLLRSDEVVQSEAQIKQWHISQIIEPLVDLGEATLLPSPEAVEQAPGCLVLISDRGLKELKKSNGVKHLSYRATIE